MAVVSVGVANKTVLVGLAKGYTKPGFDGFIVLTSQLSAYIDLEMSRYLC